MHRKLDRQNKVQSEKESKNTRQFYKVILIHESMISKAPSFQFQNASFQNGYSLPISKKKKKIEYNSINPFNNPFHNPFKNPFRFTKTPKSTDTCMDCREQGHFRKGCPKIQQHDKTDLIRR